MATKDKNTITNEPADDFRVSILDKAFQKYLKFINVSVENGTVAYGDIKNIKSINCSFYEENGFCEDDKPIKNLIGISFFKNLIVLDFEGQSLSDLDISKNFNLEEIDCSNNELTSLDVSQNPLLKKLYCHNNELTTLDISQNKNLYKLSCSNNQLTSLDVSQNKKLYELSCGGNQLTILTLQRNNRIIKLLDDRNLTIHYKLIRLYNFLFSSKPKDEQFMQLGQLDCSSNQLTELVISQLFELHNLQCSNNQLTKLNVSNNRKLNILKCENNLLNNLDISRNERLSVLDYHGNKINQDEIDLQSSHLKKNKMENQRMDEEFKKKHLKKV
jgi:Leucine-rich repeat (LRR) protein